MTHEEIRVALQGMAWGLRMAVKDTIESSEFEVYALGIMYASVCTSLEDDEAIEALNRFYPTGIRSKWQVSRDEKFYSGQPNPCPCEKNPDTHRHILFEC